MIFAKSGCIVGSPFPEKVIESTGTPSADALDIFSSSAASTSFRLGKRLSAIPSLFHPHSQYMQSKLHNFPFEGRTFTPREEPSLRLNIGPKTMSSKCSILKLSFVNGFPLLCIHSHQYLKHALCQDAFPQLCFPEHHPCQGNGLHCGLPM